jgi:hypothetical protein
MLRLRLRSVQSFAANSRAARRHRRVVLSIFTLFAIAPEFFVGPPRRS